MDFRWRSLLPLLALILGGARLFAAGTREQTAYDAAVAEFRDEAWSRAETGFAQFADKYRDSTNVPMALLLEAQAEFEQGKLTNAITLLSDPGHLAKAGRLADQYLYWIGELQFTNADLANAAETFLALARNHPDSSLRLRAIVSAAAAYAQLRDWRRHDAVLEDPNGIFQRAAQSDPGNELVRDGQLSLENSKLQQGNPAVATAVYEWLTNHWPTLNQPQQCQAVSLFCQAKTEQGDFAAALAAATNLVQIAGSPANRHWLAVAWDLQGAALEKMDLIPKAIEAWQNNLTNAPAAQEREAILKIAELQIVQGQLTNAGEMLTNFLAQFPKDLSADIALLTAGELHLRESAAQPGATNQLSAARDCFSALTNSPLAGKAWLDRGWCDSLTGDTAGSLADFTAAAQSLPPSEDQAMARFKMGDAQFALTNYAGALENYRAVLDDFTNLPAVAATFGGRALYQSLRACLALNDLPGAGNALAQILRQYPTNDLAAGGMLDYGGKLAAEANGPAARAEFQQFLAQFPDSRLRPEVELSIAHSYEVERNWPAAIAGYQGWLDRFPTNSLRPQVIYALALADYKAGNETNAFNLFTNFVALFPANDLAPQAQMWVAGYFFGLGGTNYLAAEKNYELVYQNPNFPTNNLAEVAQMMAGRAARARQDYNGAIRGYFIPLEADPNCPTDIWVQVVFDHGESLMLMESPETNNPLANFQRAVNVFSQICQLYPTNEAGALAWIEIGRCDLQLTNYDAATNAFAQVLNTNMQATVSSRCEAQVFIGETLENKADLAAGDARNALLNLALHQYQDVFYTHVGENLPPGETADPFWVKESGLAAARLEESLQNWRQALLLYQDLTNYPSLQPDLRDKIETIKREHPEAEKN